MTPFDSLHMVSYYRPITVTVALDSKLILYLLCRHITPVLNSFCIQPQLHYIKPIKLVGKNGLLVISI